MFSMNKVRRAHRIVGGRMLMIMLWQNKKRSSKTFAGRMTTQTPCT